MTRPISCQLWLFEIPATLLPVPFPGQSLFDPLPFTRFQVEGMTLYFLNNIFLLYLPFEPPKSTFDRLAVLNLHFRHYENTPSTWASEINDCVTLEQDCGS